MWARSCAVVVLAATAARADVLSSMSNSKLQSKTYMNVDVWAISRLLNEEGMIGSGTAEGIGDVGILYRINDATSLTAFKKVDDAKPKDYVALVSQQMLSQEGTFETLKKVDKLRGVLIYNDNSTEPGKFSAGDKFPNADCGIEPDSTKIEWNKGGGGFGGTEKKKGMHWINLGKSMFWLQDHDYDALIARWDESSYLWNQGVLTNKPNYPLAAVSLNFFMWGAPDARTCLRRGYCDGIGGQNVLGLLRPYKKDETTMETDDVVMVAAAADAASLFNDLSFGADASAAAIATTIAAAELVGRTVSTADRNDKSKFEKNIMFTLFAGEHYGYIGSSSMGNRMTEGDSMPSHDSPMKPTNLKYYLELDQLISTGGDTTADTFYVHTPSESGDGATADAAVVTALKAAATEHGDSLTFAEATSRAMPPSSYRGLFNELPETVKTVGAAVVSNYDQAYADSVFETQGDTGETLGIDINATDPASDAILQRIANLAEVVAETALGLACAGDDGAGGACGNLYYGKTKADITFVKHLVYQLMFDGSHSVKDVAGSGVGSEDYNCLGLAGCKQTKVHPMNRYVNPFSAGDVSLSDRMLYYYMSYALRNRDPEYAYSYTIGTEDGFFKRDEAAQKCLSHAANEATGLPAASWKSDISGALFPYSAGQTGETAKYCTKKAKKGDEAPTSCDGTGGGKGASVNAVTEFYKGSSTWNWVMLPPVDDTKCNDRKWKPGDSDIKDKDGCVVQCVYTSTSWIDAPSPAFIAPEYTKLKDDTKRWATWTESSWQKNAEARVFLVADPATDTWTFIFGSVYFILSFVLVHYGAKKVESADDGTMFDGEQ